MCIKRFPTSGHLHDFTVFNGAGFFRRMATEDDSVAPSGGNSSGMTSSDEADS